MSTESVRELLELASKAEGVPLAWPTHPGAPDGISPRRTDTWAVWNPLADDGDALRLAVKLRMQIDIGVGAVLALPLKSTHSSIEHFTDDAMPATRRAIFLAAVEIGRAMP